MIKIKIGVISDTHLSKDLYKMEQLIDRHLNDVDLIIHAGDYKSDKVIQIIKNKKNLAGVWGNNDGDSIKSEVKEKLILTLCGYKIGVYHGHGEGKSTMDRAYEVFEDDKVDIIIFGHSHQPIIKTIKKTLMLNPGSPTSKRKERWFSIIILELNKDCIKSQIELFNKI